MPASYRTVTTIEARAWNRPTAHAVVTVMNDCIRVATPAIEQGDHVYAEAIAKAILGAIKRARRIHRQTYGRSAP